jgi:hypothetical protein
MHDQLLLLRSYHDPNVGVDRSTNTIRGIKVIEEGPINDGRPYLIDQETLRQVVAYGNAPNKGTKCRYTHGDFDEDSIGTHLGRWFNFRIDGTCVRADLKLAQSSRISPKGDIGGYVLTLAEEDPESFGASIAAELDRSLMEPTVDGKMPLRLSGLYSVDIVNEPAATRGGLFSKEFTMAEDAAPEEKQEPDFSFLMAEDMPIEEKMKKVAQMLGYEMPEEKKEDMEEESMPEEEDDKEEDMQSQEEPKKEEMSAQRYIELFGDRGARWFLEGKSPSYCFGQQLKEAHEKIAGLEKQVSEMSGKVKAAKAIVGEDSPASLSVAQTEEEKAKAAFAAKIEQLKKLGVDEKTARWSQAFASISKK